MKFNPDKPYNELPDILPDERYWHLLSIYEQANKANRAMAELKGRLSAIPNPDIFINTLSLQEAKDSSSIENVFTTNDKLFKAFTLDSTADPHTKEVLRYGKALVDGFGVIKSGKTFSVELIELIYRSIKEENDGIRDFPVYIGNDYRRIYTPPCCRDVISDKLNNWISVANLKSDEIDPLIKMAILHYQFEVIHPFKDGNGRTGRVINVLLLSAYDLLDDPILYLSKYINENKNDYYRLLMGVTENNRWEEWILFILKAIEATSKYTLDKVLTIIDLFNDTMLDKDLAIFYGVKPIRLREQVKRNIKRFPFDFIFQLTEEEVDLMVSQNAIPSKQHLGGSLPFAFTEQGVATISAVLTSERAIEVNIRIIRAFVAMRRFIDSNTKVFQRLDDVEKRQIEHKSENDQKFEQIFNAIEKRSIKPKQGIFFDGQIFNTFNLFATLSEQHGIQ